MRGAPAAGGLGGIEFQLERGWVLLKLHGPFPLDAIGVLASVTKPLAEAAVSLFAISTFDTDYILVKRIHAKQAIAALTLAGHKLVERLRTRRAADAIRFGPRRPACRSSASPFAKESRPPGARPSPTESSRRCSATINVPAGDRFQVITEHPADGLVYDPGYLGIRRTDDVVFIEMTLNLGRTLEMKKAFYARIAENLARNPGLRKEDVFINLVEVPKENWSFGNGEAQYAG